MLEGLFPEDVATAWGDPVEASEPLFPEEEALVARAVPKRQREFQKGRECARRALAELGVPRVVLLAGKSREPLWPEPVVGSITHTNGLCVAAVARSSSYAGLGIDAEPAEPLAADIAKRVCTSAEVESFGANDALDRDTVPRLVFSAKESVYKCLFPITRTFLGFEDVRVELGDGIFHVEVLAKAVASHRAAAHLVGRWLKTSTHLVTAVWVER